MTDIEDEELNRAILQSLRENYRDDNRYRNEDEEIHNLRYRKCR